MIMYTYESLFRRVFIMIGRKYSPLKKVMATLLAAAIMLLQIPVSALDAAMGDMADAVVGAVAESITLNESVNVTQESTFAFTPSKTAVYRIYSSKNVECDPTVILLDKNNKVIAENDDSAGNLNFELNIELTAGELYYVKAGAYSEAFNYFLTLEESRLLSIEIVSIPTFETIEYDMSEGGNWISVYEGEIVDRYFTYNPYPALHEAVIRVNYIDGSSEEISYFDENGEYTGMATEWDFYNNPWKVGTDNHYYVTYKGLKALANATVTESPIESMSIASLDDIEFIEGDLMHGYWSSYYQGIDLEEKYFSYNVEEKIQSIKLAVTYKDGTTDEVTFYNEETDEWNGIRVYSDQYLKPWTLGENEFEIWYKGACITATATLSETPVESISIVSGGSFEYAEGDENNGYWMGNDEFYYYPDRVTNDLIVEITYKDGTKKELEANYQNGITYRDTQHENPWTPGGENLLEISYMGVSTTIKVTVKPGIVESIVVEDVTVLEGTHGSFWRENINGESVVWYHYDVNPEHITVNLTDGSTVSGTPSEIYEQLGLNVSCYPEMSQFYQQQWGVGQYVINASLSGKKTTFLFKIEESNVESIEVSDVEFTENTNGSWDNGYRDENGNWQESEWYRYSLYNHPFTVNFKDGTSFTGTIDELSENYNLNASYFDGQTYDSQWQAGKSYTVTLFVGGKQAILSVTIVESDIKSIEVIDTQGFVYYENDTAHGYWEDGYFRYSAWDLASKITILVTYKDGSTKEISYFDKETGEYTNIEYSDPQWTTPWTVGGENKLIISYGGAKTTINATVLACPVESIVVEPITHLQYTGGYWNDAGYWDENDNWVSTGEYFHYYHDPENVTVTFKDGSTVSGTYWEIYEQTGSRVETKSDQRENHWDVGEHTATLHFMGFEAQFTVIIAESNVENVIVEDMTFVEGTNGSWQTNYDNGTYITYYYYDVNPEKYTVVYKDGTSISGSVDQIYEQTGYNIDIDTVQNYENPWGVGEHTVRVSFMGVLSEYTVTITPSPVESITVDPISYIEYTNGSWSDHFENAESTGLVYYHYSFTPQNLTIKYTDGTSIKGNPDEIYELTGYNVSWFAHQDYYNQWSIGTHSATVAFMGKTADMKVEIVPSPIESIVVEDLYIEEGTRGNWSRYYSDLYFEYHAYPDKLTVNFKDGTSITGSYDEVNEKVDYSLSYDYDQDRENPWGVGQYTATLSCYGKTVEYNIFITDAKIESIKIYPVISIVGKDGYSCSEYYDKELGQWFAGDWFEYRTYPEMMVVTFNDGTVLKRSYDDLQSLGYSIVSESDQSYHNQWGVGKHSASLLIGNHSYSFTVEIVEETEGELYNYAILSNKTAVILKYNGNDTDVVVPDSIDGYSVSTIYYKAFENAYNLTTLTLPSSLRYIDRYAFCWCHSLETIKLYAGLEMIGTYAFADAHNISEVIFYGTAKEAEQIDIFDSNYRLTEAQWKYVTECSEHVYDNDCDAECNNCYASREVEHDYEWVIDYEGTCVEDGYKHEQCVNCDATRNLNTPIPSKGEHTNTELLNIEPATCGRWGYSGDLYCNDCHTYVEYGEATEPTGLHQNTGVTGDYDATCSSEGYTGDIYCYDCGNILALGESIPAKEHANTSLVNAYPASCGNSGYTGDLWCNDCGQVLEYGESIPATEAHGRTYLSGASPADCAGTGYTGDLYCSVCNELIEYGKIIPATGDHVYDNDLDDECNVCGDKRDVTVKNATLSLESITANQGETVRVDVKIDGNSGFAGLQFGLIYNDIYLTLKSVETEMDGFYVTVDNSIVFDSYKNFVGDGVIASLFFEVSEDAPIGKYDIQLRFMSATCEDFNPVVMTDAQATITVESALAGDVNGDGRVDVVDLVMLRKYLATMDPITQISTVAVKKGADANGDGLVDTIDLVYVRQYLASMTV